MKEVLWRVLGPYWYGRFERKNRKGEIMKDLGLVLMGVFVGVVAAFVLFLGYTRFTKVESDVANIVGWINNVQQQARQQQIKPQMEQQPKESDTPNKKK